MDARWFLPAFYFRSRKAKGRMQDHIHTGFPAFVFAGLSAIVMINVLRLVAAQMVLRPGMEPAGRFIGSLVNFG